jgi:hypothetical protein
VAALRKDLRLRDARPKNDLLQKCDDYSELGAMFL